MFYALHNKGKRKRNKMFRRCGSPSLSAILLHHSPLKLSCPWGFYNLLSQSSMFPISSSSCCFIHKNGLWLTLANGFLFYHCQFSSNFFQYSYSYFLSPHPYNNFAMYFPSSSLLNVFLFSSVFCCLVLQIVTYWVCDWRVFVSQAR